MVYLGEEMSPIFLFGLSTVPWVQSSQSVDSTTSVLPQQLTENNLNASVYFENVDNAIYRGETKGYQSDLLNSISLPSNWQVSDTERFDVTTITAFTVVELIDV